MPGETRPAGRVLLVAVRGPGTRRRMTDLFVSPFRSKSVSHPTGSACMASSGASRPPRPTPAASFGLRCPGCSGEGVGDRESIVLDTFDLGAVTCLLCGASFTPRKAIARYEASRPLDGVEQIRRWGRFAAWIESAASFID